MIFTRRTIIAVILTLLTTAFVNASSLSNADCFSFATNYYEEVFCEIKAENISTTLPDFWQFKKNNERTQALLIKRPALAMGIQLPTPRRTVSSNKQQSEKIRSKKTHSINKNNTTAFEPKLIASKHKASLSLNNSCQRQGSKLLCSNGEFIYQNNLNNSKLAQGALEESHKLNFQHFSGSTENQSQLQRYLSENYVLYLEKMQSIGLASETFSFAKFSYFFHEHNQRNIDFTERFEKMFYYLKQDKKTNAVNTKRTVPDDLKTQYCMHLNKIVACEHKGRNYLFKKA